MFTSLLFTDRFGSTLWRQLGTVSLIAICISLALVTTPASAVDLVNDTWIDGNDTEPGTGGTGPTDPYIGPYAENNGVTGTDADSDGNLESRYFRSGTGSTLNPVAANGPLRLDLTAATGSATLMTYFTPEGSEVNLANAGDKIRVTWAFTLTGVSTNDNTSQNFRFALVDSSDGSRAIEDGASIPAAQWRGYGVWANMETTLGNSNPFQLRRRTLGNSGNLLNTTSDFGDVLGNGATSGATGYADATPYTMTWEITRNASNGLDIDVKMVGGSLDNDGTAQVTVTDPTPVGVDSSTAPFGSYKFDAFSVRPSSNVTTANIFDTSLFRVEFLPAVAPGTPGDFNNNNKVDAGDYVTWRANEIANVALPNDNGVGNQAARYTLWRQNFGNPGSGAGLGGSAVPEPCSLVLVVVGLVGGMCIRRRP
jgi:hypothetical protein